LFGSLVFWQFGCLSVWFSGSLAYPILYDYSFTVVTVVIQEGSGFLSLLQNSKNQQPNIVAHQLKTLEGNAVKFPSLENSFL
jgi:hypothetical protein